MEIQQEISILDLKFIRNSIENMSKINQVDVLRILNGFQNVILNENNYGVHVNLTELETATINALKDYIKYVQEQENNLQYIETQKNNMKLLFKEKELNSTS